jgi:hypothetical protein
MEFITNCFTRILGKCAVQDYAKGQKRDIVKVPDYGRMGCGFYDGGLIKKNPNLILRKTT